MATTIARLAAEVKVQVDDAQLNGLKTRLVQTDQSLKQAGAGAQQYAANLAGVESQSRRTAAAQAELSGSLGKVSMTMRDVLVGALAGAAGFSALQAGGMAVGRGLEEVFSTIGRSAIGINSSLETATLQFGILMKDTDAAKAHVKDLFDFAKATPFETGPVIEASRLMLTLGGAAFNTKDNLKLIGDAAAGASVDIKEIAFWVSRAYSAIQAGRPFGEASERLSELGLLSGTARAEMERLSAAGASGSRVWNVLSGELQRFDGSMIALAGTWEGLTSTATDSMNLLLGGALKPLFEEAKKGLEEFNKVLESDDAQRWGEGLANTLKTDVIPWLESAAATARTVADVVNAVRNNPGIQVAGAVAGGAGRSAGGTVEGIKSIGEGIAAAQAENARVVERGLQELRSSIEGYEDIKLEASMLRKRIKEPLIDVIDETVADVQKSDLGNKLAAAMGIEDAAAQMGPHGSELVTALTSAIRDEGEKSVNLVAQSARKIMDAWLKELPVEEARRRGADLNAALIAAASGEGSVAQVESVITSGNAAVEQKKQAEEAKKEAERQKREAEAAVREAKRIAEEWRRTMPITQENFAAFLGPSAESASYGQGKAIFDALTKAIKDGGEESIRAAAETTAQVRQRMLDAHLVLDAEAWANGLTAVVNRAIASGTPAARAAVGEYVKEFDIARQLAEAGDRSAQVIRESTDKTQAAIRDAQTKTEESIARLREDFDFSQSVASDMERLQDAVRDGMRDARRALEDGERELALSREQADIARRNAREDETGATARAHEDRSNALSRTREDLSSALMRARQERDVQIASSRSREDLAREHQKRLQEIQKAGGPNVGTAIGDAQRQYQEQLEGLSRTESRARADRERQRADQEQDRDQKRAQQEQDRAQARQVADADRARARQIAEEDRTLSRSRADADRDRHRVNEQILEVQQRQLEAPIKALQLGVQIHGLEQQIADTRAREKEQVDNLNKALQETIDKEQKSLDLLRQRLGVAASGPSTEVPSSVTGGFAAIGAGLAGLSLTPPSAIPTILPLPLPLPVPASPADSGSQDETRLDDETISRMADAMEARPNIIDGDSVEPALARSRVNRIRARAIG